MVGATVFATASPQSGWAPVREESDGRSRPTPDRVEPRDATRCVPPAKRISAPSATRSGTTRPPCCSSAARLFEPSAFITKQLAVPDDVRDQRAVGDHAGSLSVAPLLVRFVAAVPSALATWTSPPATKMICSAVGRPRRIRPAGDDRAAAGECSGRRQSSRRSTYASCAPLGEIAGSAPLAHTVAGAPPPAGMLRIAADCSKKIVPPSVEALGCERPDPPRFVTRRCRSGAPIVKSAPPLT